MQVDFAIVAATCSRPICPQFEMHLPGRPALDSPWFIVYIDEIQ